jgi:uncharacterized protein YjbJ (UPF0337 family)
MATSMEQKWSGRWDQFKGKVKETWGVMTDNDLDELEGKYDQVVGRINERTGEAREEIARRIRGW